MEAQKIEISPTDILFSKFDRLIAAMEIKSAPAIWGVEQIASWMGLSEVTVATKVIFRPDFPSPFTPAKDGGHKRWFADDVIEWARLNRGLLPKSKPKKGGRPRNHAA